MAKRGYRTIRLPTNKDGEVAVYTSARVADTLQTITANATLYEGVRLTQVLEAVYEQGKKDGARAAFEQLDKGLAAAKKQVRHKRPGRPRKRR
jgi:hypothetical protein